MLNIYKNINILKKISNYFNYYPGLKFRYSKSKIYKKFEILFTTYLAKQNNSFKNIFFSSSEKSFYKNCHYFKFNKFDPLNNSQLNSLSENGIIVLEDVLYESKFKNLKKKIEKLITLEMNKPKKKIDLILTNSIYKLSIKFDLNKEKLLNDISSNVTTKVYGTVINPTSSIIYTKALKIPEKTINGDNNFHPDRYLPNLKMFFYINDVELSGAPFSYAIGSHKINKKYLNYYINNKSYIFHESNSNSKIFLKSKKKFPVKKNSLIIALTNGFHGRAKFNKLSDRTVIFLQYPDFNLKSLLKNFLNKF